MKIYLASDHAGFELKEKCIAFLLTLGYEAIDMGPATFDAEDDYPDYIRPLALKVSEGESLGVVFGGSGTGEAIVANRVPGVRAGVYYGGTLEIPKLAREHNNANVLSLGARFISEEEAFQAITVFIETSFSNEERHMRRIQKI